MDESGDLQTYRVQLEQVEAALVGDPDNEELLKLKGDLVDIINLTEDLLGLSSNKSSVETDPGDSATSSANGKSKVFSLYDDDDDVKIAPSSSSAAPTPTTPPPPPAVKSQNKPLEDGKVTITNSLGKGRILDSTGKVDIIDEKERVFRQHLQELKLLAIDWKVGDRCQATNPDTNQFADAEVLATGEGYVQVRFMDPDVIANVALPNVRKIKKRRWGEAIVAPSPHEVKRQLTAAEKEKKKKKKQTRKAHQTEMEQAKEKEKSNWLKFMNSNKTITKTAAKKSIFASPDNFEGKIGIGTCGIAGKGMTSYNAPDKWKK